MVKRFALLLLTLFSLAALGCSQEPTKIDDPPSGNIALHLLISNQSFDLDPVDVDVFIDKKHVVTGDLRVNGQHTWYPFDFYVPAGPHTLRVEGLGGDVTLNADFDVSAETWGVLNFWYYEDAQGGAEATPKHFDWTTSTTEPMFD
jgi:hypothetical protein